MTRFGHGSIPAGPVTPPAPATGVNKWLLLKAATLARRHLGVSDRDLSVLAALLSFHPATDLVADGPQTVFPSNAALAGRLHGMPESTLRRHLAALVTAGLIARRDSPNGKRYARRAPAGQTPRAFGFDLLPLARMAARITHAADAAKAEAEEIRSLREDIRLALREAAGLLAGQDGIAECHRLLRRKLSLTDLRAMHRDLRAGLDLVTQEMSATDSRNERHIQSSEQDPKESELAMIGERPDAAPLSLGQVLMAAPDLADYSPDPIRTWQDLLGVSAFVAPLLGIAADVWTDARARMGDQAASAAVACILQQAGRIQRPGAYLRALGQKAGQGCFDITAMVRALLNRSGAMPC